MLNSIVNKVFVITTLNSDRVDYIKNHLIENDIKFDFCVAPDTKIIEKSIIVNDGGDITNKNHKALVSLISSYVSIVESSKISGFEKICVIEDDCFFEKDWSFKLKQFMDNLPKNWDLLNIGYHHLHDTDTIKEPLNRYVNIPLNWHHTTHCMIIKYTCYDKFLNIVKQHNYSLPADYMFNEIYKEKVLNCFFPNEKFIFQLSYRDELSNKKYNNFKSLMCDT